MRAKTNNMLLSKIEELYTYTKDSKNESQLKLHSFLNDLKSIEPSLSVLAILNHLVAMHQEGYTIDQIQYDVRKTKQMFHVAKQYVKSLNYNDEFEHLTDEIHSIIIQNLESAIYIYNKEYDI